jgi:ADP-heptose:LPS heptosyltransferase
LSLSLKGFYALARRASLYVGGDTGPTHLAVAAGTPVAGLFGPTEWWRNGSPRAEDICVERNDINCRTNCHRRSCSQWICMDIGVEQVLHFVGERLRRAGKVAEAEAGTLA